MYYGESFGGLLLTTCTNSVDVAKKAFTKRRSVALVLGCTVLGAAAQILIKMGANSLTHASVTMMLSSPPLMFGYFLYGISAVLLIFALRDGELSILYPVISLTYVWVTALSILVFNEKMNFFKVLAVVTIVVGVGILGRGEER